MSSYEGDQSPDVNIHCSSYSSYVAKLLYWSWSDSKIAELILHDLMIQDAQVQVCVTITITIYNIIFTYIDLLATNYFYEIKNRFIDKIPWKRPPNCAAKT